MTLEYRKQQVIEWIERFKRTFGRVRQSSYKPMTLEQVERRRAKVLADLLGDNSTQNIKSPLPSPSS